MYRLGQVAGGLGDLRDLCGAGPGCPGEFSEADHVNGPLVVLRGGRHQFGATGQGPHPVETSGGLVGGEKAISELPGLLETFLRHQLCQSGGGRGQQVPDITEPGVAQALH